MFKFLVCFVFRFLVFFYFTYLISFMSVTTLLHSHDKVCFYPQCYSDWCTIGTGSLEHKNDATLASFFIKAYLRNIHATFYFILTTPKGHHNFAFLD